MATDRADADTDSSRTPLPLPLQVIMATNRADTLDPALLRPGTLCLESSGGGGGVWGGTWLDPCCCAPVGQMGLRRRVLVTTVLCRRWVGGAVLSGGSRT